MPERPLAPFDRVVTVKADPGQQCLYPQRYGTIRSEVCPGVFDVLLDEMACVWYQADQLKRAPAQTLPTPAPDQQHR